MNNYPDRTNDPLFPVAQTLNELEIVKQQGLFGILRLRWEAWTQRLAARHIVAVEKSRQEVLKAKQQSIETGFALSRAYAEGQREIDRQHQANLESQQRRMLAEAALRPDLHVLPPNSSNTPRTNVTTGDAPIRPYLTDEQLDKLARDFLAQFPIGQDFEAMWQRYAAKLEAALPEQALKEVKEQARTLVGQSSGNFTADF